MQTTYSPKEVVGHVNTKCAACNWNNKRQKMDIRELIEK